jgi:hypothetical protein
MDNITVTDSDFHRNGVSGLPFQVAIVKHEGEGDMLVVMFENEGHTAVFNLDKLAMGDISFGSNSYRGDQYEHALRGELW